MSASLVGSEMCIRDSVKLCRSLQRPRGCGGASLCLRARRRRSSHASPRRLLRLRGRGLSMPRGV
eukprot:9335866-Alexandrium_andersonii.AAC.1